MSHCISVYLVNKSEVRNDKIESIVDNKSTKIKWTELGENILATTYIPNIKEYGKDRTIAKITTDYFGGSGEQTAKLFVNNERVYNNEDKYNPINNVLRRMGVIRKDKMDEFDTIGLGKYRSNQDFR
jgi:hypothetical protein